MIIKISWLLLCSFFLEIHLFCYLVVGRHLEYIVLFEQHHRNLDLACKLLKLLLFRPLHSGQSKQDSIYNVCRKIIFVVFLIDILNLKHFKDDVEIWENSYLPSFTNMFNYSKGVITISWWNNLPRIKDWSITVIFFHDYFSIERSSSLN